MKPLLHRFLLASSLRLVLLVILVPTHVMGWLHTPSYQRIQPTQSAFLEELEKIGTIPHEFFSLSRLRRTHQATNLYSSRPSRSMENKGKNKGSERPSSDASRSSRKIKPPKDRKDEGRYEDEGEEGFFRGWFRRGKDDDSEKDNKASKSPKVEDKNFLTKVQSVFSKEGETLQKVDANESTSESSLIGRVQSFFVRNTTDDKDEKSNATVTINPLSVVQKFFERPGPEEWITVFPKTRIMPGQMVPVTVAGLDLLVIASRDGRRLYCINNSCPHLGTPLETGTLVRLPRAESASSASDAAKGSPPSVFTTNPLSFTETDVSNLLSQDGCEDCVVCPLHRTAFALESGEVRGEWCPYPPVIGKMMGTVKKPVGAAVFDVRTRGKNVQVRINTPLIEVK